MIVGKLCYIFIKSSHHHIGFVKYIITLKYVDMYKVKNSLGTFSDRFNRNLKRRVNVTVVHINFLYFGEIIVLITSLKLNILYSLFKKYAQPQHQL